MKKQLMSLMVLGLAVTACDRETAKPDNTIQNFQDRSGATLTPTNQSETAQDRTITQNVRRSLMNDNSLSTNAKNIKVITIDSSVTLRGIVNDARERSRVADLAKKSQGVRTVDNQTNIAK